MEKEPEILKASVETVDVLNGQDVVIPVKVQTTTAINGDVEERISNLDHEDIYCRTCGFSSISLQVVTIEPGEGIKSWLEEKGDYVSIGDKILLCGTCEEESHH